MTPVPLLRANLKTSNAHAGGLFGIQDARLATVSELPEGKNALNTGLLKSITGGDDLPIRDVGEKAGISRPARGTLLLAMNDNDLSRLKLDDPALVDRCYILPYPSIPEGEQDKGFVDAVKESIPTYGKRSWQNWSCEPLNLMTLARTRRSRRNRSWMP